MKISEIPFVGYPFTDLDRTRAFYEDVLGLKQTLYHEMEGEPKQYWIEYDIGPGCIAISNAWPPSGSQGGPTIALEVDDLDAAMDELKANGVTIDSAVMQSPSCRFFLFQDPDGNPMCLHQMKGQGC